MRAVLFALCIFAVMAIAPGAFADNDTEIATKLSKEYSRLRKFVSKLKPEFEVGGYLNGKVYGDHEILWHLGEEKDEAEVIRIYRDKGEKKQHLDVTYHHSSGIVKDRTVIRRFVGPSFTGWRNDTMDVETGEYLGMQGTREPNLDERDLEILKKWKVEIFD